MIGRMWTRLATALVGPPPPRVPPGVRRAEESVESWPAFIPDQNPLESETGVGLRQRDVLSLMDADCYGYLIVSVRKETVGPRARIEMAEQLDPSWWPAIARVCETIAAEARKC